MITQRAPYSFRDDPDVPDFDVPPVFTVMDAQCGLCAKGATWIARNDRLAEFRIIPVQSMIGHALCLHYGLDPKDPTTWLYVEDGIAFSSLDALVKAGRRLGGKWRMLGALRVIPRPMRDMLYRLVARHRYRFFGRTDMCALPDPDVQKRLLRDI